jgi:hypothetical protein
LQIRLLPLGARHGREEGSQSNTHEVHVCHSQGDVTREDDALVEDPVDELDQRDLPTRVDRWLFYPVLPSSGSTKL